MLKKIFRCFVLFAGLWAAGYGWFIMQIPDTPTRIDGKSDLIVVLTGGAGRLEHGMKLLAEGKGRQMFVSGVHNNVTVNELLMQADPPVREEVARLPPSTILIGHDAYNTIGNAEETARLLADHHYGSIRLVTSAYHMPRSVSEFRHELPDVTLVPEPVFTDEFPASGWWLRHESRLLALSEYHKFLAGKLRHFFLPDKS